MNKHAQRRFAGFDDWIEIFRAGTQTDSAGNTREWSEADLDSIISNFDPEHPAPAVVGHPKHDDPAWGWVDGLKRAGATLLAKFRDVDPGFERLVREGRFRNRSIAIDTADDGYRLRHVGWLGAAKPAIDKLKPVAFQAIAYQSDPPAYEFELVVSASTLQGILRRMREWLIDKYSIDEADRVLPTWDVDMVTYDRPEPVQTPDSPQFSQGDQAMKTFTQAELDAAVSAASQQAATTAQAAVQAERDALARRVSEFESGQRRTQAETAVHAAIERGVAPALLAGAVEFLQELGGTTTEFEFTAAGDAKQKQSLVAWFSALLNQIPPAVKPGTADTGGTPIVGDDANAIAKAAREYVAVEAGKGNHIRASDAVAHVMQQQAR